MLEILLWMFLGILFGVISGLIPGIHINMIAALLFSLLIQETFNIDFIFVAIFIVSIGITHTFIDFIPSLFLGVPSADTVVSMLPGHQLVSQGRGFEALQLSAFGSLGGVGLLIVIGLIAYHIIFPLYETIFNHVGKVLLFVLIFLICKEDTSNGKFWAIIIVLLSGGFGLIVLNSLYVSNSLFLIFTGMFGIASLLLSIIDNTQIVPQNTSIAFKVKRKYITALCTGGVSSMICSVLPGLGNAQAGTLSMLFFRKLSAEMMLVLLSTINTVNFGLSLLTLYVLDKARNGAILVLKNLDFQLTFNMLIVLFVVMMCVALFAYQLVFILGKCVITIVEKINATYLNISLVLILSCVVFLISNISEIVVYILSTLLGMLCVLVNVRRVHLMSVLLLPIIIALW